MSDPWQPLADDGPGLLDEVSKRRASRFLGRLLVVTGFVLMPYFMHKQSWQDSMGVLALAMSFGGMLSATFAVLRGERFATGSLNGLDEALVFVAVSRLAHMAG